MNEFSYMLFLPFIVPWFYNPSRLLPDRKNFSPRKWTNSEKELQLEEKIVSDGGEGTFPKNVIFNKWIGFPKFIILELSFLFYDH